MGRPMAPGPSRGEGIFHLCGRSSKPTLLLPGLAIQACGVPVLSSKAAGFHARRSCNRDAHAGPEVLVAVARTFDLPTPSSARAAHPHST